MKKHLLGLVGSLVFASLVHGLPTGAVSIPFSTSQAQFLAGDSITIQEVFATSPNFTPGTTVVVRGTYTLQSSASALLSVSVTASVNLGLTPVQPASRTTINAGSGTFELENAIQYDGTLHVTFAPTTSGSSFGSIYFAAQGSNGPATPGTPATPTAPAPGIDTSGVVNVPFSTSQAQFLAGDAITIQSVLATSPNLAPGDTVLVRGTYTLQSSAAAVVMISLTSNAPGATVRVSPSSRTNVNAGSGSFEVAYEVTQPGSLHVSFYPTGSGSSFGGVYFAPPGGVGSTGSNGTGLVSPATNTGLLGNLSIRTTVSAGDGVTAGLTVTEHERYVLIRAVGPTLAKFGVAGTLSKPVLSVYGANGELVASTGSWSTNFSAAQRAGIELVTASVGAFALTAGSDDAVLHLRLVPGGYTVTVSAGDNRPGVALLEVYTSPTFILSTAP